METGNVDRVNGSVVSLDVLRGATQLMQLSGLIERELERNPFGAATAQDILADMVRGEQLPGHIVVTAQSNGELAGFLWGVPISDYGVPILYVKMVHSDKLEHTRGMYAVAEGFARNIGFKRILAVMREHGKAMARVTNAEVVGLVIGKDL